MDRTRYLVQFVFLSHSIFTLCLPCFVKAQMLLYSKVASPIVQCMCTWYTWQQLPHGAMMCNILVGPWHMQNVFLDSVTTKLGLRFFAISTILCGGVDRVFEGWHGWCAAAPCRCSSGLSTFQSRWEVSAVTRKLCQLPRPVSLTKPWKNSRTARKDERLLEKMSES